MTQSDSTGYTHHVRAVWLCHIHGDADSVQVDSSSEIKEILAVHKRHYPQMQFQGYAVYRTDKQFGKPEWFLGDELTYEVASTIAAYFDSNPAEITYKKS